MYRNEQTFVGKDLIELVGIKGIYPVLRSLCDKGLIEKKEPIIRDFISKDGKVCQNEYKTYHITDSGKSYVDSGLNKIV
jgi:DNA-binding PadR family transcriptional regulator